MSATNPQEDKSKPVGLSNKVLFVDYYPTQHLSDVLNTTETPMFNENEGYKGIKFPNESGPLVNKKADLLRFHIGKYYKAFPTDSVYNSAPTNTKEILNNDSYTSMLSGEGSNLASKWSPKYNTTADPSAPATPSTKLQLASQYSLTDYHVERNFSPFHATITKETTPSPGSPQERQQWILLNYRDRPQVAGNAKLPLSWKGPDVSGDPGPGYKRWKNYVLDTTPVSGVADAEGLKTIYKLGLGHPATHTDHSFIYNFATTKPEITDQNSFFKTLYASVDTEYLYYMKNYEEALGSTNANIEHYLPNLYIISDIAKRDNIEFGVNSNLDYKAAIEAVPGTVLAEKLVDATTYLEDWSAAFGKNINNFLAAVSNAPEAAPEIYTKARNLIIPPQRIKDLADMNSKKSTFPMSTEIEFITDRNCEFSDFLVKTNVWDNLLSEVIESVSGEGSDYQSNVMMKGYAEQEVIEVQGADSSPPQAQNITAGSFDKVNANIFDLSAWMENTTLEKYKLASESAIVLDPDYVGKKGATGYDHNTLLNILGLKALQAKFFALKDKNRRSFQDILQGDLCYNETVFYRVAKIDADTSEVVQSFYFVNNSDIDVIKYVDTQLFYGKNYKYIIYAWQLVFGNEYDYKHAYFEFDPPSGYMLPYQGLSPNSLSGWETISGGALAPIDYPALIDLRMKDSAVLIEVPYYETSPMRVLDDPPVPPDVELIPYKNTGDRILMFLRPNTGEYELTPQPIEESDETIIEILRLAKGYGSDDKVVYSTDDHVTKYEIYRTTEKPTSYKDFAGKKIVTLQDETSFVDDTIQPNTKYYYIFRCIDNHGFMSNPTEVYELEMVQNLETVYPIINVVSMEKYEQDRLELSKIGNKNVRKYMYVKPSQMQTELSYENSDNLLDATTASEVDPTLGLEDQAVLGRKFKIRLTSKKTGKRLDFNLDFRTSYDKTKIVEK